MVGAKGRVGLAGGRETSHHQIVPGTEVRFGTHQHDIAVRLHEQLDRQRAPRSDGHRAVVGAERWIEAAIGVVPGQGVGENLLAVDASCDHEVETAALGLHRHGA